MRKIKDLCVVTRKYNDKNGNEKRVWKNVGGVYVNDDGNERYAIDPCFNFAALRQENSDLLWLSAFPAKPKGQQQDYNNYENHNEELQPYNPDSGFDANATIPEGLPPF